MMPEYYPAIIVSGYYLLQYMSPCATLWALCKQVRRVIMLAGLNEVMFYSIPLHM